MTRVILADDHDLLREGLALLLEREQGIEVVGSVASGGEAVTMARELRPDVVVMDIAMAELNGIEATRRIRDELPGTRIVILSMHASSEHVYRAFGAGASGYILKEAASRQLVDAIREVTVGRTYLSEALRAELGEVAGILARGETSPLQNLSGREREVFQLVVEGRSSARIAEMIHLSPKTVETYRKRIMKKLGVKNATELIRFAVERGM